LQIELLVDRDAFIKIKNWGLFELLMNNFIILLSGNLSIEVKSTLKKSEWAKFQDRFLEVELTEKEENLKPKVIRRKYGKEAAKSYAIGRFKKYEGEIDAICISKFRGIPFITLDKNAQLISKNFEIEVYDLEEFINTYLGNIDKNLQEKFIDKIQEYDYKRKK